MSKGYVGKIIRVNLKKNDVKTENLNLELAKKYIGARGIGVKIITDEVDAKVDPLGRENKIVIATGPVTGYSMPTGGRYMVMTKSPLTGGIAFSNSGGKWGTEFKNTGHDLIILEDIAEKPVYISIEDDKIEIKDAQFLMGKTTKETQDALHEIYPKESKVLCIGPSGEKKSLLAGIMNDTDRSAARSGVGAVMGSKNLKAIIVRGTKKLEYKDNEEAKRVASEKVKMLREHPVTGQGLPTYGTAVLVNIINENGAFPVNNYQESYTEEADKISGETLTDEYLVKKSACYKCPIACGRVVKNKKGEEIGGPEYETLWAFGSDCGVYDMEAIIEANEICNEYGLDTISVGATIAAAMELKQRGFVKDSDIAQDGLSLDFGDAKALVGWTKKAALREGFGAYIADGSYRMCEHFGATHLSITVKKQELPAYDPRGVQGQGITYAVSNRGACHVKGYMISPEILGAPEKLDRFEVKGKPAYAKVMHDLTAVIDSLGLCIFTSFALGAKDYADMVNVCYGEDFHTAESIMESGDRIWNLEKLFNIRAGMTAKDDFLPKRLTEDEIKFGPSKGWVSKTKTLVPEYYEVRGWDKEGIPTNETLKKLGLEEYACNR